MAIKFGTDGWRAVIAEEFTYANVEIVTRSIALYVLGKFGTSRPVIIGYDLRFMADRFARFAAEILNEYGINVEFADTWHPTPVIAYVAMSHNSAGAMMFTASHNPPEYLGIKFIPEYAGPAMPDITDVIVANVRELEVNAGYGKDKLAATPGTIQTIAPREEYLADLKTRVDFALIDKAKGKRVLYDAIHGAGQGYVDTLLKECGVDVTTMRGSRDALFGGTMPEPDHHYLPELMARVPAEKFDLGLSSDGDCDRFGVVDEKGQFLSANQIIPMVFRHLYKNKGLRGKVVRSLATSKLLDRLAEVYGGVEVIETPVGFKWIGHAMRENTVVIAGEESGGFSIQGHIPEKDGVLANLIIVEMLAAEGKSMSEIYADTIKDAGMPFYLFNKNYDIPDSRKAEIVNHLKSLKAGDSFNGLTITGTDHRDGVKLYFGTYDWITVRPSGTEPKLRTYMESASSSDLEKIKAGILAVLNPQPAGVGA